MATTLHFDTRRGLVDRLRNANLEFSRHFPGDSGRRQPVHTVYGGAHLFKADTASRLGVLALRALEEYAPEPADLVEVADLSEELAPKIHERVIEKLRREPVEDFRADFEDGYGNRPDEEEDGHAATVAREMAAGMTAGTTAGTLPPFIGIRIKPFTEELRERSFRTIDLFLTALTRETGGRLPDNFVVTLPKVTIPEQVAALADLFDLLEPALHLPNGTLHLEIMVETAQSILDAQGRCPLPLLVNAARGRCVAAHFGTYDYTASCSITAAHQSMDHPACDFAKHMMQVAFAGTDIQISDGATNVLPVPPHRGEELTAEQIEENRAVVHDAWWLHSQHIRHSLLNAFYQGWDLHPAQLVTRYATVFAFFLEGLDAASERLHNFVQKAAQATLVGEVFDDAATGQGLLNYFLRAVNCGALSEEEALERSGLTLEELRGRSFVKILANRRG